MDNYHKELVDEITKDIKIPNNIIDAEMIQKEEMNQKYVEAQKIHKKANKALDDYLESINHDWTLMNGRNKKYLKLWQQYQEAADNLQEFKDNGFV